jgi:hypothetical protein
MGQKKIVKFVTGSQRGIQPKIKYSDKLKSCSFLFNYLENTTPMHFVASKYRRVDNQKS